MTYAIIGFGSIGKGLAKAFARKGIAVSVSTTRDPASFADEAAAIGSSVSAVSTAEAITADILFLTVPFGAGSQVARTLASWEGKIIIDVTNAYGIPPEDLDGKPSSAFLADAFTGAKLVKGFNHLVAAKLEQDPAVTGGRRVVFLAGNDVDAVTIVEGLAEQLGFAPVQLGGLAEGGLLVQARGKSWGPLIFKDLVKADA